MATATMIITQNELKNVKKYKYHSKTQNMIIQLNSFHCANFSFSITDTPYSFLVKNWNSMTNEKMSIDN